MPSCVLSPYPPVRTPPTRQARSRWRIQMLKEQKALTAGSFPFPLRSMNETAPEVTEPPPPPSEFRSFPPRCSRQQPFLCNNSGLQLLSGAYQTFRLHCPSVSREYLYDTIPPPPSVSSHFSSISCLPSVSLPNTQTPSAPPIQFTSPMGQVSPQILCKSPDQHIPIDTPPRPWFAAPCVSRGNKVVAIVLGFNILRCAREATHKAFGGSGGMPALALLFLDNPGEV